MIGQRQSSSQRSIPRTLERNAMHHFGLIFSKLLWFSSIDNLWLDISAFWSGQIYQTFSFPNLLMFCSRKTKKKKKENKAVATFGVVFLQVLWQTTYTGGRTVGQTENWKDRQKDKRSHGRLPYVSSCFSFNVWFCFFAFNVFIINRFSCGTKMSWRGRELVIVNSN